MKTRHIPSPVGGLKAPRRPAHLNATAGGLHAPDDGPNPGAALTHRLRSFLYYLPREEGLAYLYIVLGAALGAPLRYYLQGRMQANTDSFFPVGTLAVNLTGCLAIGVIAALVEDRGFLDRNLRIAVLTGFLGSYTTFSTFAYESVQQLNGGELAQAFLNIVLSVAGGLFAAWCGATIVRWF